MARKSGARRKDTGAEAKPGIYVRGNIRAGRDVIMGDQINDLRQQVAQIVSPHEFLARLQELEAILAQVKQQPGLLPAQVETIEVVEGQIQQVVEEAKKPKPLAARITATLTGAKAVMDSLGEGVKSAIGLGAVLAGLAQMALKVFGG